MTLNKAPENSGWQGRVAQIPEQLVNIWPTANYVEFLTPDETRRMLIKLDLVSEAANLMVRAMIKGTIKYPQDDWPIEVWEDHGLEDSIDSVLYQMLGRHARRKARKYMISHDSGL